MIDYFSYGFIMDYQEPKGDNIEMRLRWQVKLDKEQYERAMTQVASKTNDLYPSNNFKVNIDSGGVFGPAKVITIKERKKLRNICEMEINRRSLEIKYHKNGWDRVHQIIKSAKIK